MGKEDREKKPWTNIQNLYKNLSKGIKCDNFCYCKVGRVITKWGAIEKSPIAILEKFPFFEGYKKNISHFDGSNTIFSDCNTVV